MKTRRFQKGSLQTRTRGGRKVWCVLYRHADGRRGYAILGAVAEMTKKAAAHAQAEFMAGINGGAETAGARPAMVREFLEESFLPFMRLKWKGSTRMTSERRIHQHIAGDLGARRLESLTLADLQGFLQARADAGLSKSTVAMLKFDLRAIFRMAAAEGVISKNPTPALYTPRVSKERSTRTMTQDQVLEAISALPQREALILHLACLVGMRPGEILALQRRHVGAGCEWVMVRQRVYEGLIDDPKTQRSKRRVSLAAETRRLLRDWLQVGVEGHPDAFVFASGLGTPLRANRLLSKIIQPALAPIGLDWFTFQVARRTHASLGHDIGIDPKVAADQRGHGIGVSLDTYTRSGDKRKAAAAETLAKNVLQMPRKEAV